MSEKIWSDDAWEDYLYWQSQDKKPSSASISLLKILSEMVVSISPTVEDTMVTNDTYSSCIFPRYMIYINLE